MWRAHFGRGFGPVVRQTAKLIISLSSFRMGNVTDKICTENQSTHSVVRNSFFENCAIYEIMWKNIVEWGRPQIT
jgi:TFIIF-interacting CTD phosphatase-like protein